MGPLLALVGRSVLSASAAAVATAPTELSLPSLTDTLSNARLSAVERTFIIKQVSATSFDSARDWNSELLAKRIKIENLDVLVVRGSNLVCGGTGNCQTWLFQKVGSRWLSAIAGEAPVISSLTLKHQNGQLVLLGCSNVSAANKHCTSWYFEHGKFRTHP